MEASAITQPQAMQLHLQRFSPENVAHNAKQLYYIRSVFTSVAGSAAGVFGLTNLDGFYCYLISIVVINLAIFIVNVQFQPSKYLISFNPIKDQTAQTAQKGSKASGNFKSVSAATEAAETGSESALAVAWRYTSFFFEGAQEMAFGFVLWWTLWTAIIHVYE